MTADRNATGIVFNIQKYSVNDGPGIRTVVFLKGCPLRCKWCSNPVSQLPKTQILWDPRKCLHCGHCVQSCPVNAIRADGQLIRSNAEICTGCGKCVRECPGHALKMEGEKKTVQQVLDVVLQDMPFYEESGGGLTVSGGEMLMQPDYSYALFSAAKEEGLHTCCETTGAVSPEIFEKVIGPVDVILFDVKHWDPESHREGTGISNELPLRNLKQAIAMGKQVLPRIPVIPRFNDRLEDAAELAECLKRAGAAECQLLPFHQFGENKYEMLGEAYAYKDESALHREDLGEYLQTFIDHGIQAFF